MFCNIWLFNIFCFAYPRLITALHHQWELSNWFPKALQLALGFVKLCSDNSNTPIQLCILTIQHLHHPLHIALGIVCQLQLFLSLLQLCLELLALCSLRIIRSIESLAVAVPLLVLCLLEGSWLCPPTTFPLQTFDFSFSSSILRWWLLGMTGVKATGTSSDNCDNGNCIVRACVLRQRVREKNKQSKHNNLLDSHSKDNNPCIRLAFSLRSVTPNKLPQWPIFFLQTNKDVTS